MSYKYAERGREGERERERGSRTSAEPSAKSRGRAKVQVNFWVFAQIFRPHVADDVHSIEVIDQGFVEGGGGADVMCSICLSQA